MSLKFVKATKEKDIKEISEYNIDAFSDSPDFKWTLDEIKAEVKDGWELFAVFHEEEIVAALFYKKDKNALLTKHTAIKIQHQGSGFSHEIKEFFEDKAKELGLSKIVHYCGIDNFRMYSLNESHGYEKTENRLGEDGYIVEWIKKVS